MSLPHPIRAQQDLVIADFDWLNFAEYLQTCKLWSQETTTRLWISTVRTRRFLSCLTQTRGHQRREWIVAQEINAVVGAWLAHISESGNIGKLPFPRQIWGLKCFLHRTFSCCGCENTQYFQENDRVRWDCALFREKYSKYLVYFWGAGLNTVLSILVV